MPVSGLQNKELDVPQLLKKWELKSLDLMKRHSNISEISIENYALDFPIYGHWLTMSTLISNSFKMNLKLFFTTEQSAPFCAALFKNITEQVKIEQISDFTKELCNLIIGRIKSDFEKNDINCIASLPISLRSFDQLFFTKNLSNQIFELHWKFRYKTFEIMALLSLEILDPSIFQNLNIEIDNAVINGSFELL